MSRPSLGRTAGARVARLMVVDDHPAVRAGLTTLLEDTPGLRLLRSAAGVREALKRAREEAPDIALVDVSLSDGDGLRLCLQLKRLLAAPRVVLYTASSDSLLGLKARLVGADGVVAKTVSAAVLRDAIAAALQGIAPTPSVHRAQLSAVGRRLSPEDLALIGLRLDSTSISDTAAVLGLDEGDLVRRLDALLESLGSAPVLSPQPS
jgi:DNA-binding NarL/FixJ family response regulator